MKTMQVIDKTDVKPNDADGKKWPQILAIGVASLTSFTCGVLFAWCSPSIPKLITDKANYDITLEEASYMTVIPPIASLITSPVFGWMIDAVGRKWTILFMMVPHLLTWILVASARSVWVFYWSRLLAGIADACMFSSVPVYISEVSTPAVRGTWGNAMTFSIYLGQLWVNVVGGHLSIQTTAFICVVFTAVFACTFPFCPETPYYLLTKGRYQEARVSLEWLRRKENVGEELIGLQADVNRQLSEPGTWADLFRIESNRKALYAGLFLRVSQQLSGTAAITVYTQYIFEQAGGSLSAADAATIFCVVLVAMNVFGASLLDKIGRKKAMMFSLFLCSASLYTEMSYFYVLEKTPEIDVSKLNWIPVFGLVMYVVFFQLGAGIVPTLMLGELFSQSVKGKGLCVLNVFFGICVSTITKLFQVLQTQFGFFAPFGFFATCTLVSTFLAYYLVPETRGKTLEEIQQSLKGNEKKVPQGRRSDP